MLAVILKSPSITISNAAYKAALFDVREIYNCWKAIQCLPCLLCRLAEPVSLIGFPPRGPERSFGDIEIEGHGGGKKNPMLKNLIGTQTSNKKKKKFLVGHFSEHAL